MNENNNADNVTNKGHLEKFELRKKSTDLIYLFIIFQL